MLSPQGRLAELEEDNRDLAVLARGIVESWLNHSGLGRPWEVLPAGGEPARQQLVKGDRGGLALRQPPAEMNAVWRSIVLVQVLPEPLPRVAGQHQLAARSTVRYGLSPDPFSLPAIVMARSTREQETATVTVEAQRTRFEHKRKVLVELPVLLTGTRP